ncbi:MAG: hypothetical protein ACE141_00165 [Bryobacteraceae bacterium]
MVRGIRPLWLSPRVVLAVFLVFSSGALVGALVMRWSMNRADSRPQTLYAFDGREVALDQMVKELQLDPVQAQQLQTMLDDFVMYVQMLQMQMDEVRATGKSRILGILDEQQKAKFEKMMNEVQAPRP